MTGSVRAFHPHLNIYHHQHGLLFQFILSDFLAIQAETKTLELLQIPPQSYEECGDYLKAVAKLVGATHNSMRLFVWNQDLSLLSKFKTYCNHFAHQKGPLSAQHNRRVLQLQHNANQAWLYSTYCLDLLHLLRENEQNPKSAQTLCKVNGKLLTTLQRISKALVPFFDDYWEDENVLFFLLRHRLELDQIYGEDFVLQQLNKMHPEGLPGIEKFLLERFSKRGFDHLIPIIVAKVARAAPNKN